MVYFVLFVLVVVVLSGFSIWAYSVVDAVRSHRESELHKGRMETNRFCQALLESIKADPDSFDFREFIERAGYPRAKARTTAEGLYARAFARSIHDGVLSAAETQSLQRFARAVQLDPLRREAIESSAKQGKYRDCLDQSLAEGVVSHGALQLLDQLRKNLGLSELDIRHVGATNSSSAYLAQFREIVRHGEITENHALHLAQIRSAMGISEEAAYEIIRHDALALYHERFCEMKQDGSVAPQDLEELKGLQEFLAIPPGEVEHVMREIERIRFKDRARSGEPPRIMTRKLLEGGEVCHWDTACRYVYETKSGANFAEGELTITNRRLIFTSHTKSFEFKASKVIDIDLLPDFMLVRTSGAKGTGSYHVSDSDFAAAILEGVVRKHKFLAAERFSSTMSRRIPDTVKQEVWARDGGCCSRCSATEYLEFDHIIPHSKGGASSVPNVQLLCRRCNLAKSDRIG